MDILLKIFIDMDTDLNKFMLYLKTPPEEPTLMTSEISVVKNRLRIPKSSLVSDSKELLIRLAYMTLVLQKLETWYKNSTVSNKTYATVAVKILVFASNIKDAFDHTTRNSTTTNVKIPIPVLQSIMDSSIQGAKFTHKINLEKYMKLIMDDLESEYDIEKDDIHVTDIIYYQNLAWLLANSQIETIRKYSFQYLYISNYELHIKLGDHPFLHMFPGQSRNWKNFEKYHFG
ncbi:hypothetical protein C0J52_01913 [Blattella germanica]|nr:hypothetical protein C0J52_01913 [Blattella germanica]